MVAKQGPGGGGHRHTRAVTSLVSTHLPDPTVFPFPEGGKPGAQQMGNGPLSSEKDETTQRATRGEGSLEGQPDLAVEPPPLGRRADPAGR